MAFTSLPLVSLLTTENVLLLVHFYLFLLRTSHRMHTHERKYFILCFSSMNDLTRLNVLNELNAHTIFFKKTSLGFYFLLFFMPLHLEMIVWCVCLWIERRLMCWDEHKINLTHVFSLRRLMNLPWVGRDTLFCDVSYAFNAWSMTMLRNFGVNKLIMLFWKKIWIFVFKVIKIYIKK